MLGNLQDPPVAGRTPPCSGKELSSAGCIHRDVLSAPRIEAPVRTEALALLGYAMAEDRLFPMDMLRRASGRTAELFGIRGVAADRRNRTLGFAAVARQAAQRPPGQRALLDAFAWRECPH